MSKAKSALPRSENQAAHWSRLMLKSRPRIRDTVARDSCVESNLAGIRFPAVAMELERLARVAYVEAVTINRSGRSFDEELAAFERWLEPSAPVRTVRAVAYDYTREDDWSFPDAPEVDAEAFEAILRSATRGWVRLTPVAAREDLLTVAVEFFADPHGREQPAGASVSVDW